MSEDRIKVIVDGDASGAVSALSKTTDKIKETGKATEDMAGGAAAVLKGFTDNIMRAGLGFGTMAGFGAMAAEKIGEGLKAAFTFIPDAINDTKKLSAEFQIMSVTAGMSVREFNTMNASLQMAGGTTEDLTAIMRGMQRGIRTNSEVLIANGVATDKAALAHMTMGQYISNVVRVMGTFGDATDRDQLLMAAFERGGIAFSAQLVNMNKHMGEAAEMAERNGPLNQQSIADLESNRKAMAEWGTTWQQVQAKVAQGATPLANSALQNAAAFAQWAAIGDKVVAVMNGVVAILSSTTLQFAALVGGVYATIAAISGMSILIPILDGVLTALGAVMTITAAINWPFVLAAGAIALVTTVFMHQTTEAHRLSDANLALAQKAAATGSAFSSLAADAKNLDKVIEDGKTSVEDRTRAQKDFLIVIDQMKAAYPGFIQNMVFDKQGHLDLAASINKANEARERELVLALAKAKVDLESMSHKRTITKDNGFGAFQYEEGPASPEEIKKQSDAVNSLSEALKSLHAVQTSGHMVTKDDLKGPKDQHDTTDEWRIRLQTMRDADVVAKTLDEERIKEEAERHDKAEKAKNELTKSYLDKNNKMTPEAYSAMWDQIGADELTAKDAIDAKYKERKLEGERKLQEEIASIGQKGLEARLAEVARRFDEMRKYDMKNSGGQHIAQINTAQGPAEDEARKAQEKADLEELKKKLAEATQIKHEALSHDETGDFLSTYAGDDKSKQAAVKKYKMEVEFDGTASQGALSGFQEFSNKTDNLWKSMQTLSLGVANSMANTLGKAFTDILTKGMTFGNAMKQIWKGLTSEIIASLMQVAARQLVNWGVEKGISAWKIAQGGVEKAAELSSIAVQGAKTAAFVVGKGAAEADAAAEIYAAYSMVPGGTLIADGLVAKMVGVIEALQVTAHATGGIISSPTLALMGEAGPEIVAPQHDFNDWAHANQNLGYNLATHNANIGGLQAQAGTYGSNGLAANGGRMPSGHTIDARGSIFMDSNEAKRKFDALVNDSNQRTGRVSG